MGAPARLTFGTMRTIPCSRRPRVTRGGSLGVSALPVPKHGGGSPNRHLNALQRKDGAPLSVGCGREVRSSRGVNRTSHG